MEGQSFHTSLLGGFRKKDVIRYLAEEKRRQEETLAQLREKLEDMEQSASAPAAEQTERWKNEALQARIAELQAENDRQAQQLQSLRDAAERCVQQAREMDALRDQLHGLENAREENTDTDALAAAQERCAQLEAQLEQLQSRGVSTQEERLHSLCGKLEQVLELLDKAADGPRHVICYPVSPEEQELLLGTNLAARTVEAEPETTETPEVPEELSEMQEEAPEEAPEEPALPEEPEAPEEVPQETATPEEMPNEIPEETPETEHPQSGDEPVSRLMERVRGWRR